MNPRVTAPHVERITDLRRVAHAMFATPSIDEKVDFSDKTYLYLASENIAPGRPEYPLLVPPSEVPRRGFGSLGGRAALVHAVCHIEFNAIHLALDAVWRFDGMPDAFYRDWWQVACEEALHFRLLRTHLQGLARGADSQPRWDYGSFAAHNGLWEMCEKTAFDVVARMALVPRLLEARGLDATPQIQSKLAGVKTPDAKEAVAILDIILRDEIGHVAIGNRWYRWLCAQRGLEPLAHFKALLRKYRAPRIAGPYNLSARLEAGFTTDEMAEIARLGRSGNVNPSDDAARAGS